MVQNLYGVQADPEHLAKLNHLIQLSADAIQLYDGALERVVDDAVVTEDLLAFRTDLKQHVADLGQVIVDLGGVAAVPSARVKGPGVEALALLRNATRTKGILAALRTSEQWIAEVYDAVASLALPKLAWRVVERNLDDEQRHLAAIEMHIARLTSVRRSPRDESGEAPAEATTRTPRT